MNLLALPRYGRLGASSRLRTLQYLPWLERAGISVHTHSLLDDEYVRALYAKRRVPMTVVREYIKRMAELLASGRFDVVYLEQEALPWLPLWLELGLLGSKVRLVIDHDDAVFHRYGEHRLRVVREVLGAKLDRLMRRADLVTAGNAYLGERAASAGCSHVEIVPTVVDITRYPPPGYPLGREGPVVVGWIGSPATADYLRQVVPALERVASRHAIRCVAIGARPDQLVGTPFEAQPWSEEGEVELLRGIDIGIMPLPDGLWERGKCGYKLIQYMACGLPVVASPVGVNREIVHQGESGFLAESTDEWANSIEALLVDAELRRRMGAAGRDRVEQTYCLQVQAPRLIELLTDVAARP